MLFFSLCGIKRLGLGKWAVGVEKNLQEDSIVTVRRTHLFRTLVPSSWTEDV